MFILKYTPILVLHSKNQILLDIATYLGSRRITYIYYSKFAPKIVVLFKKKIKR